MRIIIESNDIGSYTYEYEVKANGKELDVVFQDGVCEIPCLEGDKVEIVGQNIFLNNKKGILVCIIMWFFALLSGTSEPDMFGYPLSMMFSFNAAANDVKISLSMDSIKGLIVQISGAKNIDYSITCKKSAFQKWIWMYIIPMLCISSLLLILGGILIANASTGFKVILIMIELLLFLFLFMSLKRAFRFLKQIRIEK